MTQASGTPDVPDLGRRQFMNLLTFGAVTGTALGALYPIVKYFIPPSSGAAGGGVTAKDALGNDIVVSRFLAEHTVGSRTLAQGLKGDPTYLVVQEDGALASYGINSICTHLGLLLIAVECHARISLLCPC
ncbi:MAG: cytochrome b6-f complex iron-sulfur subunit, partial [Leptolyngbyaceae cyanobacterium SM1_1_3]|nr:cytochrome b6-f complex iron-sulfur subunit [Leptolyngbyaceae cyanobacterium SM1_1_3]